MGQKNRQKVAKNAKLAKSRQNGKKCQNSGTTRARAPLPAVLARRASAAGAL